MSRKTRTLLTVQLRVPQPAGYTQKQLVNWLQGALRMAGSPFASFETQVRIAARETTYL